MKITCPPKFAIGERRRENWPTIMGILNVTPDSFSDGGKFLNVRAAIKQAQRMIKEGADIIDIGGESSGPGSNDVSFAEELRRVIPIIKKLAPLAQKHGKIISIDTYKAEVARQAIEAGATMVNDVTALRGDIHMADLIAKTGVPIVLMYSKDPTARTTRTKKRYKNVIATIEKFLLGRITYARVHGIKKSQIIIDPGMGAFISAEPRYSYEVLKRLAEFKKLGFPLLVGVSRKSFLPGLIDERDVPTLAANVIALQNGADIIRVHAVAQHVQMRGALSTFTKTGAQALKRQE